MRNGGNSRNSGRWTEARFNSFIKGGLRKLSQRWPPKYEALKAARLERGVYKCQGYKKRWHKVRKKDGVYVDHIIPVVDPVKGFQSWDDVVERLFCEADNLQVLCKECHNKKSADERKRKKNADSS